MNRGRRMNRVATDERGQVLVFFVILLVVLLGIGAIAIDVGRAYVAQRQLRAAADAAAVAAANDLPVSNAQSCAASPVGLPAAYAYSASNTAGCPTGKNAIGVLPNVTTTVALSCLTQLVSAGVIPPCQSSPSGGPSQNAVTVTESASLPLTLGKVLPGVLPNWSVSATSTAAMHGGAPHPADIMIVLDRTGSMGQSCTAGGTKLACAKAGIMAFLGQMLPWQQDGTTPEDMIGFETFPPVNIAATGNYYANAQTKACQTNQTANYDNTASKTTNPNWAYVVVPLANDFRATNTSGLNANSNLVKTVNCLQLPGASQGTSYADAIDVAEQYLQANGRPNAQDVIVFLSDGEANYGPVYHSGPTITAASEAADPYRATPCHQAVTSAHNATNAGAWVYTIAYAVGSSPATSTSCAGWKPPSCDTVGQVTQFATSAACLEAPAITAFTTMQNMASDSSKFFFNPTPGDLTAYFSAVAASISTPRLVFISGPDGSP